MSTSSDLSSSSSIDGHGGHVLGDGRSGSGVGDVDRQVDLEALTKNIDELEGLASRSVEQTAQLAELYVVLATCGGRDGDDLDAVIGPLTKAAKLLERTLEENEDDGIRCSLGNVYLHQAEVYDDYDHIEPALEYYEKAIVAFQPLDDKGDGEAKYDIAGIRLNRGMLYHEMGEFDKAKADFDASFMAYRAVEKISDMDTRYYMAKVSMAQGDLFRDMDETLEVVVDVYNRAMRLFVELIDIGQIEHERDLALALLGRCMATYESKSDQDAESGTEESDWLDNVLLNIDRAVEIFDKVVADGVEEARDDLFNALLSKGAILLNSEQYEDAASIFDRAIAEFSDFADDVDPILSNHCAAAFENRGICSLNLGKPDDAVVDFDQAIRIRERIVSDECDLDEDSKAVFISGLATTYANRANAYSSKGDIDKAQADGRHGLDLIRSIGVDRANDAELREIEQLFENLLTQWK